MADDPALKTPESDETSKRKRRIIRPAVEPTTLRGQSEKAQAEFSRPGKHSRAGRILSAPFRLIARLVRPLGRFRLVKFIGYIFAPPFIRNAWRELMLVTWPDARQTRRLTFAVIIFSLIFGSIVAVVDYGFDKLFRALVLN